MIKRWKQKLALTLVCCATTFGFGGCLGLDLQELLRFGAAITVTEFVLDNDSVFDLFPDGAGAG